MSRGHSVLRTIGQLALTSPSPSVIASAASSSAAHAVRFVSTAPASEERTQRRGPPRQSPGFISGPGGSGRRQTMRGRQRRGSDRDDREGGDGPQRGGRSRRSRGGPRNRSGEESKGNPVQINEGETFLDWYHARGYAAFALPPEGTRGPFWIASTPFPGNPTFDPPPPISQRYRDAMWALHLKDPKEYNLRFLSQHYGLTLERTHAVLRLKALEAEMTIKSQALQQDFQSNMERLLGSNPNAPPPVRRKKDDGEEEGVRPRRAHEPTPVPVRRGIAAGLDNRGPMIEDVTNEREGATTNDDSVVFKSLAQERSERQAKAAATPVGGPDPLYIKRTPAQKYVQFAARHPESAPVAILDLKGARSDVNYKGEGTLDQNRRAARRRSLRRQRRQARKTRALEMMEKWKEFKHGAAVWRQEALKYRQASKTKKALLGRPALRRYKELRRQELLSLKYINPGQLGSQRLRQKIKHHQALHALEIKEAGSPSSNKAQVKVPSSAVPKVKAGSSKSKKGTTSKAKHDRAEKKQVQKELAKKI